MAKIVKPPTSEERKTSQQPPTPQRAGSLNGRQVTPSPNFASAAPRPQPIQLPPTPTGAAMITRITPVPVPSPSREPSSGSHTLQNRASFPPSAPKPPLTRSGTLPKENVQNSTNQGARPATKTDSPALRSNTLRSSPHRTQSSNSTKQDGSETAHPRSEIPTTPQKKVVHRSHSEDVGGHSPSPNAKFPAVDLDLGGQERSASTVSLTGGIPKSVNLLNTFSRINPTLVRSGSLASDTSSNEGSYAFSFAPVSSRPQAGFQEPETPVTSGQTTPLGGTPSSSPLSKANPQSTPNPLRKGLDENEAMLKLRLVEKYWKDLEEPVKAACEAFKSGYSGFTERSAEIALKLYEEGKEKADPRISETIGSYLKSDRHSKEQRHAAVMFFLFSEDRFSKVKKLSDDLTSDSTSYAVAFSIIQEWPSYKRIDNELPPHSADPKPKTPRASGPTIEGARESSDGGVVNPDSGGKESEAVGNLHEVMNHWIQQGKLARKDSGDFSDEEAGGKLSADANPEEEPSYSDALHQTLQGDSAFERFQQKLNHSPWKNGMHQHSQSLTYPLNLERLPQEMDPTVSAPSSPRRSAKPHSSRRKEEPVDMFLPSAPQTSTSALDLSAPESYSSPKPSARRVLSFGERASQTAHPGMKEQQEPDFMLPLSNPIAHTSALILVEDFPRNSDLGKQSRSVHNSPKAGSKKDSLPHLQASSQQKGSRTAPSSPNKPNKKKVNQSAPSSPKARMLKMVERLWGKKEELQQAADEQDSSKTPPRLSVEHLSPRTSGQKMLEPVERRPDSIGNETSLTAQEGDKESNPSLPVSVPLEPVIQQLQENLAGLRQEQQSAPHSTQNSPEKLFLGLAGEDQPRPSATPPASQGGLLQELIDSVQKERQAQTGFQSAQNSPARGTPIKGSPLSVPLTPKTKIAIPSGYRVAGNLRSFEQEPLENPRNLIEQLLSSNAGSDQMQSPQKKTPLAKDLIRSESELNSLFDREDTHFPEKSVSPTHVVNLGVVDSQIIVEPKEKRSLAEPPSPVSSNLGQDQPPSEPMPRQTFFEPDFRGPNDLVDLALLKKGYSELPPHIEEPCPQDKLPKIPSLRNKFLDIARSIVRLIELEGQSWNFIYPIDVINDSFSLVKPTLHLVKDWSTVFSVYKNKIKRLPLDYRIDDLDFSNSRSFLELDVYLQMIELSDKFAILLAKKLSQDCSLASWRKILEGIEGFHHLSQVMRYYNALGRSIRNLEISHDQLFFFPPFISKEHFPELESLSVKNLIILKDMPVIDFPKLNSLSVNNTTIRNIPVIESEFLEFLDVSDNMIEKITNIKNLNKLRSVNLMFNQIKLLDFKQIPSKNLVELHVSLNSNVKGNFFSYFSGLEKVYININCSDKEFDVYNFGGFFMFFLKSKIKSLRFHGCENMKLLDIKDSEIVDLNFSGLPEKLDILDISNSKLKNVFGGHSSLRWVRLFCVVGLSDFYNKKFGKLNLDRKIGNLINLIFLEISNSQLDALPDLSDCGETLKELNVAFNHIASLKTEHLPPKLEILNLNSNPLEPRKKGDTENDYLERIKNWDGVLFLEGCGEKFNKMKIICNENNVTLIKTDFRDIIPQNKGTEVRKFNFEDEEKGN